MMRPTIISLSTIPSRFQLLQPTLQSLLNQSLPAEEIRLYIPYKYRRFPDWDGTLPIVPAGVSIHRCDLDYGPATKVLPATLDLTGKDLDVLFCDDDMLYATNWHAHLKKTSEKLSKTCIAGWGHSLPDIADEYRSKDVLPRAKSRLKDWKYRLIRTLTLFTVRPHVKNEGYIDILCGFAGVMVRPEWFNDAFFNIPEVMWTVDDPWISGQLARQNIPIWRANNCGFPKLSEGYEIDALQNLIESGFNRVNADLLVIEYFRKTFGIWEPKGKIKKINLTHRCPTMREVIRRAKEKSLF